ncbi:Uma2 family endonuclease [Sorangium cellulosum]|uniref:Uma2 family endonuclease n=1 Tax=Sorangium cellulosum TaxID=56 RepID=UPI003D9A79F4
MRRYPMGAPPRSPLTADQIRPGDPYELSEGELVECLPTGERGGRGNLVGGSVLDTDPAVESAGVDVGVSVRPDMLRAPDISVGNIQDKPGWASAAPPLAVEYADTGQDEGELQRKMVELLSAGTRWIWVVRLSGARRVEVYEAGANLSDRGGPSPALSPAGGRARRQPALSPARVAYPGEVLEAPGVLRNPVPVEALYDREAAHEVTLRNLLQRKGFESLAAVQASGREEGLRTGLRDLCELLAIELSPEREAALGAMKETELLALRDRLKRERRWP